MKHFYRGATHCTLGEQRRKIISGCDSLQSLSSVCLAWPQGLEIAELTAFGKG